VGQIATEHEIIKINATDKKADGSQLVTKNGKPMWRTNIQIAERPGVWINGLVFSEPVNWKGSKQRLILFTEEYDGKLQPKFKLPPTPRPGGIPIEKVDEMISLLREIRDLLKAPRA
jgi:hypothetical protein